MACISFYVHSGYTSTHMNQHRHKLLKQWQLEKQGMKQMLDHQNLPSAIKEHPHTGHSLHPRLVLSRE